jgi:hypothetical protein
VQPVALYLCVAGHVLLAACLVVFLRRQRWKEYPIFLAYAVFELVSFLVGYALIQLAQRSLVSSDTYHWTLSYFDVVRTAVELAVLYELADRIILSRSLLRATLRSLLRWSGAVLLLIAAGVSALLAPPSVTPAVRVFEVLNFASHLIVIGILFVLLLFSHALQVPWRSLSAGLALGFGITSGIEMTSSALVSALGAKSLIPMDVIRMSALLICATVWLVYVLLPDRSVVVSGMRLGKSEMEFWDHELQRMVRR